MTDIEKLMKWYNKYTNKFQKRFGFNLPFDIYGIDMDKFAKELGYATQEQIQWGIVERMYGRKAVELLDEIKQNGPIEKTK